MNKCEKVRSQDEQSMFKDTCGSDDRREINENENFPLYASECVEILDRIPFDDDKLDEDDFDYYDSLINL